jgi:ankyrin repeat protein
MGADLDSTGYCSTNSRDIHKFWNTTWRITPLHLAVANGHEAVARLMTNKGANIEAEGSFDGAYWIPLHQAAANGDIALVRLLIDKGANIDATGNYERRTPLHLAVVNGDVAVAGLLIDTGANM